MLPVLAQHARVDRGRLGRPEAHHQHEAGRIVDELHLNAAPPAALQPGMPRPVVVHQLAGARPHQMHVRLFRPLGLPEALCDRPPAHGLLADPVAILLNQLRVDRRRREVRVVLPQFRQHRGRRRRRQFVPRRAASASSAERRRIRRTVSTSRRAASICFSRPSETAWMTATRYARRPIPFHAPPPTRFEKADI